MTQLLSTFIQRMSKWVHNTGGRFSENYFQLSLKKLFSYGGKKDWNNSSAILS